jgi:hypothetical protein
VVLERRHPVRLVERDAAVKHRVLEVVPVWFILERDVTTSE